MAWGLVQPVKTVASCCFTTQSRCTRLILGCPSFALGLCVLNTGRVTERCKSFPARKQDFLHLTVYWCSQGTFQKVKDQVADSLGGHKSQTQK